MKYALKTTPLEQFAEGAAFLQGRIENTRLGLTLRSRGRATFSTFDGAGDMTLPADADG